MLGAGGWIEDSMGRGAHGFFIGREAGIVEDVGLLVVAVAVAVVSCGCRLDHIILIRVGFWHVCLLGETEKKRKLKPRLGRAQIGFDRFPAFFYLD